MRKWLPLTAICLGTLMLLIDVTIVNVALPDMATSLKTTFSSLQWVVDAYALALAALLMGIGAAGDILGHRRTYISGLVLFALSSLVCGLAPNDGVLIGARVVQGIGGAAMFATTFGLINASYTGRDRGTAYGLWGAVGGASAAIGPVLGGLLTEGLSWRWIFFVNLPVSVAAVALAVAVLGTDRPDRTRRVDVAGLLTFTAAAAAATFGMIRAGEDGWSSPTVLGLLVASAVLVVVFVFVERAVAHPLLDLTLFGNRTFTGTLLAALFINFAAFANFTYTSVWLQSLLGLSPIEAGLTGLPLSVCAFVTSAVVGRRLHTAAPGPIIGVGMVLIGVGALLSAVLVHSSSSWPALMAGFVLTGIGVGMATPTLGTAASGAVAPHRAGMAGGAVNTARQLGFAFGIALLGSVFTSRAGASLGDHGVAGSSKLATALAGGQARSILAQVPASGRSQLDAFMHSAFASGLDVAFLVAGIAGVAVGLSVIVLVGRRRAEAAPQARSAGPVDPEAVTA